MRKLALFLILATASLFAQNGLPSGYSGISGPKSSGSAAIIQNGLIGEYRFDEGTGTTVTDYSGHGNAGTLSVSNVPTWITGTGGLTFNANGYVRFPDAMGGTSRTVQIFIYPRNTTSVIHFPTLLSTSADNTHGIEFNTTQTFNSNPLVYPDLFEAYWTRLTTQVDQVTLAMDGPTLVTYEPDATKDKIYFNDNVVDQAPSSSVASLTEWQGGNAFLIGGTIHTCVIAGACYWIGPIYYMAVYNRQLTAAEVAQNYYAIAAKLQARGINTNPTRAIKYTDGNMLTAIGDSIMQGFQTTNTFSPATASLSLNSTYTVKNLGVGGSQVCPQMVGWGPRINSFKTGAGKNTLLVWGGSNDLFFGLITYTQAWQCLSRIGDDQRAAGWKVIVMTMLSRTGLDTGKNNLNGLIRNGWKNHFDGLIDVAADPNFGADGAYSNVTYFLDNIHPTVAGQVTIGGYMSAEINILDNADIMTPVSYSSGPTTMAATDIQVDASTTGGNFTLTLPSCIAKTGHVYQVKNVGTANTLTLSGNGGQTIDGSASIALTTLQVARLQVILNSASAGGCHWERVSQ